MIPPIFVAYARLRRHTVIFFVVFLPMVKQIKMLLEVCCARVRVPKTLYINTKLQILYLLCWAGRPPIGYSHLRHRWLPLSPFQTAIHRKRHVRTHRFIICFWIIKMSNETSWKNRLHSQGSKRMPIWLLSWPIMIDICCPAIFDFFSTPNVNK